MCPTAPRLSQVKTKLAISSVTFNCEERRTSGLTPTSYISPEKRDFGSHPEFTLNPEEKILYLPVVISPHSKRVPISVVVTDSTGYLDMPIPTIKHINRAVMEGSQEESHADMRILRSVLSVKFLQDIYAPKNPWRKKNRTRQEKTRPI